jgi:alpha-beta hydrolase superfamily lysophospholipase
MRHLAELYQDLGCYALIQRMPGHGTIPGALVTTDWHDWRAAVKLGAAAVRERIGEGPPLFLVGYSNGGALTLGHALSALDDPELVRADALMLFSPMIGVTPLSRIAPLGHRLTALSYFGQFAWLDIAPEFDPYKYNSFPKNAGYQTFLVTRSLREQLQALEDAGRLSEIPPVLAFQSLVDATVLMPALVHELFGRLSGPGSDLVLFDMDRSSALTPFLKEDYLQFVEKLLLGPRLSYDLTLIGSLDRQSSAVAERRRRPDSDEVSKRALDLSWPQGVYSLSHLAIVFPPSDEFYGTAAASRAAGVLPLGSLTPRGERGVTTVPIGNLLRLRHNPFYSYLEDRLRTDIEALLTPKAR